MHCTYTCDECHTSLSLQVNYIFEIEDSLPFIRKFSFINTSTTPIKLNDAVKKEFQDRDSAVIDEIKVYFSMYKSEGMPKYPRPTVLPGHFFLLTHLTTSLACG